MAKATRSDRVFQSLLGANVVYGVFGVIVMCVGIYFTVDKASFVTVVVGTALPYLSSILATLAGAVGIGASLIGCCGAICRKHLMIYFYVFALVVVYTLGVIGASSAIVFRSWISDQIRTYMRNTLQTQYGTNSSEAVTITNSWDTVQQKWYCCGVEDESWGVYRESDWWALQPGIFYGDKPMVPVSCCRIDQYGRYYDVTKCQTFTLGPPYRQTGSAEFLNEALYYRGCYEMGKTVLYDVAGYVIGMSIFMCCLTTGLIGLSVWGLLLCRLRRVA